MILRKGYQKLSLKKFWKVQMSCPDQEFGKIAVDDIIEKWEEFDNFKKQDNQTVEDFISDFESKYNRIKAHGQP